MGNCSSRDSTLDMLGLGVLKFPPASSPSRSERAPPPPALGSRIGAPKCRPSGPTPAMLYNSHEAFQRPMTDFRCASLQESILAMAAAAALAVLIPAPMAPMLAGARD